LYTTWTWRESNNAYANHDINFAFSADGGVTWLNNAGSIIGDTTAARPMTVASPGQVIQPLDRQQSLINQQAQIVMGDGSVHTVMYHRRPDQPWAAGDPVYALADSSYYDYVRDPLTADWSRHEIPGLVGTRAALARSADDTLYAVYVSPGTPLSTINTANGASGQLLTIAAAHKASGWDDWAIVYRDNLRSFVNEPRVDAERLLASGILSVYVQENTAVTSTTGTPLRVLDFIAAAAPSGDGWTPTGGGSWTTAANWTPALVPSSGTAQATIGYGFQGGSAITLDAAVTLNRLTYLGASGTIGPGAGGTLAFGGTSATVRVESAVAITAPVAGSFLKSGAGMLVLATDNSAGLEGKTLTIAGGQLMTSTGGTAAGTEFGTATTTVSVQPSGQIWLAGVTAGARTFPQTLRISGSGEGAAATGAIVNDSSTANAIALTGQMIVESDATIASLNNATYTFGSGSTGISEATAGRTLTISLASGTSLISGTVGVTTLVKAGNGTLRLGSANRLIDSGTVRIDGGTLHLGGASDRVATLALTGGAVASGTLTAGLFDLQSGTFSAVASGSGTIRKSGPGTATLSGSNGGFTGTTSITEGILAITSTAALPGWNVSGRFAVSGSATLAVPAAFSDATIATLVTTGNFSSGGRIGLDKTCSSRVLSFGSGGQGGLGIRAIGSGTLVGSSSNSFTGGLTLGGGLARVTATGGFGSGPITITGSATRLILASNVTLGNDIIVDAPAGAIANGVIQYEGSGTGRLSGGTVTVLGNSASGGTFASTGGGTLVVDGAINAPGSVPVSMRIGTTVFGGGGNYETFLINEETARLGGADGLSPAATVTIGASYAATLDLAGFDQSLAGLLKGPGSATVGNSSTTRDAILTVTGSSSYAGSIQNAVAAGSRRVSLAVDGGWLRLTAATTFSGSTAITGGMLQVGHALALAASPAIVGAGGTLAVDAAVTMVSPGITLVGGALSAPRLVIGGTAGIASVVVESGSIFSTPVISVSGSGVLRLPSNRQMTVSAASLTIVETAGGGL
ncbi:MAG: BNR-4 repeat-containing protein, partial [Pirellulales bacterium]